MFEDEEVTVGSNSEAVLVQETRAALVLGILALASSLFSLTPLLATVSPSEVQWTRYASDCVLPPGAKIVSCGDFGLFEFGPATGACSIEASGIEEPGLYAQPMAAGYQTPGLTSPRTGLFPRVGDIPPIPETPCQGGSCFSAPGGSTGNQPWIAIVDWANRHGWTVGWAASQVSGQPVHLYAVDNPEIVEILGSSIGDAHVLAQLCAVADEVDHGPAPAPLAVNMSFGRWLKPEDAVLGQADCPSANLSCELGQVLDHLSDREVALVAAAGNHRRVRYPAGHDRVIAAGTLDLALFFWGSQITGSWEMPQSSEVYMPGHGVCLPYDHPVGDDSLWPAPAGSSYASAILAGWMAPILDGHPELDALETPWNLQWSDALGCYTVSGWEASCNIEGNAILRRLGRDPVPACWERQIAEAELVVQGHPFPDDPLELTSIPSLEEWVALEHRPAPEPDPCVPCVSDGLDDGGGEEGGGEDLAFAKDGPRFVLDLASSWPLGEGAVLERLYLRLGEESFHRLLDRSTPARAAQLDQLAAAHYDSVQIEGLTALLQRTEQPSLVYVLCESTSCYWTSTPVHIKSLH